MSAINRYIFATLAYRPVRTLLSVLAIAVEVTMILTLVGVSHGTLDATARRARGVGADVIIRPPGSSVMSLSSAPILSALVPALAALPHVQVATGVVVQPLAGFDNMTGLDLAAFNRMSGGFRFLEGGPFRAPQDIIVDEYYARERKLHPGSSIVLAGHTWNVAGIFESGKLTRSAVQLPVLQQLTGNPNHLSQIYLKADSPGDVPAVLAEAKAKLPGYQIFSMEEFTSLLTVNSIGLLRNFIGVVIGVATVVGFIVVFMAMYTAVLERTREIGILKAMGASGNVVLGLMLKEAIMLAVLGTVAGIVLTYGTQALMGRLVPSTLTQEMVYEWWAIAGAIAIAGALLGVLVPAVKAMRQDVTEALAYE
jgi:putative ABC transport system permease protein